MHTPPPKLAGIEDYAVWSVLWRQYAIKAGYGTALTAELEEGADEAAQQRDQLVRADLILSLPHDLVVLADQQKTAKQLWDWLQHLHHCYLTGQGSKLEDPVRMDTLRMDPAQETGLQYVLRAENLFARLEHTGHHRAEPNRVMAMINGLPHTGPWGLFRTPWLLRWNDSSVSEFLNSVSIQDGYFKDKQQDGAAAASGGLQQGDSQAKQKSRGSCPYCGKAGHSEVQCWTKKRHQQAAAADGGSLCRLRGG